MELKPNRKVLAERKQHAQATKSARMIKSNVSAVTSAIEKWLDRIAFWKANTAKKRFLKQRKARKAAHLARLERDPKYAKRCAKRIRDQARCYAGYHKWLVWNGRAGWV
jgi:hypothetical protein